MEEKIIKISAKLFLDRGIKAVSMDDVAQALGISKRTLYEHFSSKDELLIRCLEWYSLQMSKQHADIDTSNKDILEIFMTHLFLTLMNLRQVSIAFLQDITKICKPGASEKYLQEQQRNKEKMASFIIIGQQQGYIRTDVKPELLVSIFTEQKQTIKEVYSTGKYSMEEIFQNLFVNYLRGACTLKGVQRIDEITEQYKKDKQNK